MELVERYIKAVEHYLPDSKKDDITRELRANIRDEIEAKETAQSHPMSEQEITTFLRQQGHPQKVAQAYSPHYPLVASEDMPLYKSVMVKGLILLFAYAIISAGKYLVNEQSINAFAYLFVALGSFIENIGLVLIIVTASFYYLGKAGYLDRWRYPTWSPELLPKANAQRINKSDSVSEITTSVFTLLLFWTPLWMNEETYNNLILGFAANMESWRIILTVVFAYSLVSAIYRLNKAYWTKYSLAVYIAEYIVYIGIMLYLAQLPQLVVVTNMQAAELSPIIETIFTYGWYLAAFVFSLITLSLLRKWFKL